MSAEVGCFFSSGQVSAIRVYSSKKAACAVFLVIFRFSLHLINSGVLVFTNTHSDQPFEVKDNELEVAEGLL